MAEAIAELTGMKASQAKWEREGKKLEKLKEFDDVVVPAGISVEWNELKKMRSAKIEGTLTGTTEMTLGATTLIAAGYVLKVTGTISAFTNPFVFESTAAGTAKVESNKELKTELKVKAGKYIQIEPVKGSGVIQIKGSSTWETNGQELNAAGALEIMETVTFNGNGSTLKGAPIRVESTVTLTDNATTIWEPASQGIGTTFGGGGHSYNGTVKLIQGLVEGNNTFAKLQINSEGAAEGKGVKLKKGATQTVTAKGLTSNGIEAKPARLESDTAGETTTVETSGETTGFLKLKDITTPTGVWYLPHGSEEGGNVHTVGSTIKFEAEPSGEHVFGKATGALLLTGAASATLRSVILGQATGALLLTGTSTATGRSVVTGKATGTLLLTGTSSGQRIARITGKATGAILLTGTAKGLVFGGITGKATGAFILTGTAKAVSFTRPPAHPGVSSPFERAGLTAPRQRAGVSSPTQRTGNG